MIFRLIVRYICGLSLILLIVLELGELLAVHVELVVATLLHELHLLVLVLELEVVHHVLVVERLLLVRCER